MPMTITINDPASEAAVLSGVGLREKTVSTTPTAVMGHGANGLFAYPGLERSVSNALVLPTGGLVDMLPSRVADTDQPYYGILTGQTAGSGSERNAPCDDSPQAGLTKLCMHAFKWGRFSRDTRVIDIRTLGRRRDRGDFLDFDVMGDPLGTSRNQTDPTVPGGVSLNEVMRDSVAKTIRELAVEWKRAFSPLIWSGNPSANSAGGGYKEPYGLDYLIDDGYVDAETNIACPAADSLVRSAGSLAIESNGDFYLQEITAISRQMVYNAEHMGLDPATWVICMPWSMFYALSAIWACAYYTTGCATVFSTSQQEIVNATDTVKLRDDMRKRKYLLMDGVEWPVITDQTIIETTLPGASLRATIFWVPLRVTGNRPVTFLEYFNYDALNAAIAGARAFGTAPMPYTTNGGRYLWVPKTPTNGCIQTGVETDWRIILETPQIAAKLENVKWTPRIHERDWETSGSFYVNGGRTTRTDASFYPPHT